MESTKFKNTVFTPFHPSCQLCSYSGYSKLCDFFKTGKCVYEEALREARKLQEKKNCRICEYSGYSKLCTYFETGICVYEDEATP